MKAGLLFALFILNKYFSLKNLQLKPFPISISLIESSNYTSKNFFIQKRKIKAFIFLKKLFAMKAFK